MTEYFKFMTKDNYILLNNEIWATCEDKQDARRIVTALRDMIRGGRRLEKENEQLKTKLNGIYDLIDAKIDEIPNDIVIAGSTTSKSYEQLKSVYREGYIRALKNLKEELSEKQL